MMMPVPPHRSQVAIVKPPFDPFQTISDPNHRRDQL